MAKDDNLSWIQEQFFGGFSDDRFLGTNNSFSYAKGIEIRKNPKSLKLSYAVEKSTSTECDALANAMVTIQSTGDVIAFLANGKILRRVAGAGSWTLVYTDSSARNIMNAIEYNGYLYWFTSQYIHRIAIFDIDASWSGTVTENYKEFDNKNTIAHPALENNNKLYIGDGSLLAELDRFMTWTPNKLPIFGDEYIRTITFGGSMMRLFANKTNNIDAGHKYYWNGTSEAYNEKVYLKQIVHAAINDGGEDYILAGLRPYLYISSGYEFIDLKRIPLVTDNKKCFFSPNSMCFHDSLIVMAPAEASTDASIGRGAWTYGRENKNYPFSLNFDYPTSNDNTTDIIGCVHNAAGVLYMSWKKTTTVGEVTTYSYGIDVVNTTKYRATGEVHSRVLYGNRAHREKASMVTSLSFNALSVGEKVQVYMRKNLASSWEGTPELSVDYAVEADRGIYSKSKDDAQDIGDFNFLETKILLTAGTNQLTTPELIELDIEFDQNIELGD